jgi:uncharacterized phage protein gp47/JayE
MAGISSTGFENKTNNDILLSLLKRSNSSEFFGQYFPTSPDSKMGILSGIISAAIKENWDGLGVLAAQQNRDTAEGKYLDDIALLAGLTRLLDSGSVGHLKYTGFVGTLIPINSQVRSASTNQIVLTKSSLFLTEKGCNEVNIAFNLLPTTLYTVVIQSNTYQYTSTASPTISEIIGGLLTDIGTPDNFSVVQNGDYLKVSSQIRDNDIDIGVLQNCSVFDVSLLVQAQAIDVGAIAFLAGTLSVQVLPLDDVTVTNPENFTLGRLEETDEQLRVRISERPENTGTATSPAIRASISNIEGVTDVIVVNNRTLVVDGDGRPPKSFQVYVEGGLEQVIAQTILNTQPAGIESHGSITRIVTNENGDPEPIKFSRFFNKYVWVRIYYSLNPEEVFPANGETAMKEAVVAKGKTFYKGEDLVASKFYGSLYNNVKGMFVTSVQVAITDLITDTPVYTVDPIPVARNTNILFNVDRCEPILV